jgi:hypothetical protein
MPTRHSLTELHRATVDSTGANVTDGFLAAADGAGNVEWIAPGAVGVTDHGALTGLADDDHSAYLLNYGGGEDVLSAHGNMGSTETFAPASGNWHSGTFNAACTFTFTAPTGSVGCTLFLELAQDGTGGWAMTLPASFANKAALEAAQVTTASTVAFLIAWTRDGGTTWYGGWVGAGSGETAATTVTDETTFGITPAVGTDTEYARQDHTHGTPDEPTSGGVGAILISDTPSTPLVFADLIQNEAQDDLVYADV